MAVFVLPGDNSRQSHTHTHTHTVFHRDKSRCYNGVVTMTGLFYLAITRDNSTLTLKLTLYFTAINRGATIAVLQWRCLFYPAITRDNHTLYFTAINRGATMAVFVLPGDNSRQSHTHTHTPPHTPTPHSHCLSTS
jgi:hypothetical protein